MGSFLRAIGMARKWMFTSEDGTYRAAPFMAREVPDPDDNEKILQNQEIVVVGDFGMTKPGEWVEVWGKWSVHSRHGLRFQINSVLPLTRTDKDAAVAFLASGEVDLIGEVLAARLGEHFGDDLPDILERHPERLAEVSGIGLMRAEAISKAWNAKADLRRVFTFFATYGISGAVTRRAYHAFGPQVINKVQEDPFSLLDVSGIGFITAEFVARSMGMEPWSVPYVRGALRHLCEHVITQDGHTAILEHVAGDAAVALIQQTLEGAGVEAPKPANAHGIIEAAYQDLLRSGRLERMEIRQPGDTEPSPVVIHPKYLRAERAIAEILLGEGVEESRWGRLANMSAGEAIELALEGSQLDLSDDQLEAVRCALTTTRSVVTGGPGTGKTTVVRTIVDAAQHMGMSVGLCAPTGKAAKRLSEVTSNKAATVHRLLGFAPREGGFGYGALRRGAKATDPDTWERLPFDLIIVDEASMLDVELAFALFSAVGKGAHLLLVGDFDQLPSVGPGNVLGDIIQLEAISVIWLTKIYRQGDGSGVVAAAHRIVRGDFPARAKDFEIRDLPALGDIVDAYLQLAEDLQCDMRDVQVLMPTYKGDFGIDAFNAEVQARLTQRGTQARGGKQPLFVGDRVIQLKNDYDLDIVNGDVGFIDDFDPENLTIDFDGVGQVKYPRQVSDNLRAAYAISVHKSQGSEYRGVIIVLHRSNWRLLQRNVLYTAVTRAKTHCILFSSTQTLQRAVTSHDQQLRLTTLPHWITSTRTVC